MVAIWQVVFNFALLPFNTLPILAQDQISWADLPRVLADGWQCLLGYDTIVDDCWRSVPVRDMIQCDTCVGSWWPVLGYMFFNIALNAFVTLVLKHGSAAILNLVMTLRLPLVQFAFSMPSISSPPEPMYGESIVGLIVIILGMVAYRWTDSDAAHALQPKSREEDIVMFGINSIFVPMPVRRNELRVRLRRHAPQIRAAYYSSLGMPGRFSITSRSVLTIMYLACLCYHTLTLFPSFVSYLNRHAAESVVGALVAQTVI
jgi:hypothetical protein